VHQPCKDAQSQAATLPAPRRAAAEPAIHPRTRISGQACTRERCERAERRRALEVGGLLLPHVRIHRIQGVKLVSVR
jgi:hypothetical protein